MSQILVSMSLYLVITVVNSSNTATDISGHSKQAQESQVNVIPSYKLKQREQLLQPNKSASTIKLVDQCDRADNTMCKIFLIYQIKHYPEAVKAINGNPIGTRLLSRPRLNDYPRLTSDRTTNPNSNIALKADILLTIPRIQRKISNDDEQTIKDSDHIMRVADSAQGGIAVLSHANLPSMIYDFRQTTSCPRSTSLQAESTSQLYMAPTD